MNETILKFNDDLKCWTRVYVNDKHIEIANRDVNKIRELQDNLLKRVLK